MSICIVDVAGDGEDEVAEAELGMEMMSRNGGYHTSSENSGSMNSMQTCNSVTFYLMKNSFYDNLISLGPIPANIIK